MKNDLLESSAGPIRATGRASVMLKASSVWHEAVHSRARRTWCKVVEATHRVLTLPKVFFHGDFLGLVFSPLENRPLAFPSIQNAKLKTNHDF